MASGWLRGIVKEVPSGDTVVISATVKSGIPPEKRISLSSLIAPKLGFRDGSRKDEPFAFESREFLRTLCIGQPCVFRIDYKIDAAGNREFGSVFLGQQRNVALEVVAAGWARVKTPSPAAVAAKEVSPFFEDLKKAEEDAESVGLGLWDREASAAALSTRDLKEVDSSALFVKLGKGGEFHAIVEQVLSGSTVRIGISDLPALRGAVQFHDPAEGKLYGTLLVQLAGVQTPSMSRPSNVITVSTANKAGGAWGSSTDAAANALGDLSLNDGAPSPVSAAAAAAANAPVGEPFAREAKYLTESRTLQRDVRVVAEGLDRNGNLFVSIYTPPLPPRPDEQPAAAKTAAAAAEENLSELLVRASLARCVEYGLNLLSTPGAALHLREVERQAKERRSGVWTGYVPPPSTTGRATDGVLRGRIIEVVSGDSVIVKAFDAGLSAPERRLQLSSLRAPRPPTRNQPAGEPWGFEARELLRKEAVGKWVEAKPEYTRKVPAAPGAAQNEERVLSFANVELLTPEEQAAVQSGNNWPQAPAAGRVNLAEVVLRKGLAQVVRHRTDEERSAIYERLLAVEEVARQSRLGTYGKDAPPIARANDLSGAGAAKAKLHLPFFQRSGRVSAVVDFVLSAHRLKLFVPKEGVTVAFAPSGIRTPVRAMPAQNGRPATQAEPYAEEALAFTRELLMQRDVEVVIEDMDRGGTFLGALTFSNAGARAAPVDFALELLKNGYARLQPYVDPLSLPNGAAMVRAESAAKEARQKIWENWSPEQDEALAAEDAEEDADASSSAASVAREQISVGVTEVPSASEFFVQLTTEPRAAWLATQLAALGREAAPAVPPELKVGQLCAARYDGAWYRAYVERTAPGPQYELYFIDFGNSDRVGARDVRALPSALAAITPQAIPASLAGIKVPKPNREHADEAHALLEELIQGGVFTATVFGKTQPDSKARHPRQRVPRLVLALRDKEDPDNEDPAAKLVTAGLARIPAASRIRDPQLAALLDPLRALEEEARAARRGIWTYGNPGDSDEEDEEARPRGWGGRAGAGRR